MDLSLYRLYSGPDGVLSVLNDENDHEICIALEHAYPDKKGWKAKIPPGVYTCIRGEHRLVGAKESFITFEITNVPGHSKILFHCGNTEKDSAGCVLLGEETGMTDPVSIVHSRKAFDKFMCLQTGVDSFTLTVEDN